MARAKTTNSPYSKLEEIPLHVFSNRECTKTPSPELRAYLRYMLNNHPNDLQYIWRYTQLFKDHGGCYYMRWSTWLDKLEKDLNKQE